MQATSIMEGPMTSCAVISASRMKRAKRLRSRILAAVSWEIR
jgi:hypothetical protein